MNFFRHPVKILLFAIVVLITQLASSCDNDAFNSSDGTTGSLILNGFTVNGDGTSGDGTAYISDETGTFELELEVDTDLLYGVRYYVSNDPLYDPNDPNDDPDTAQIPLTAIKFYEGGCGGESNTECGSNAPIFDCRYNVITDPEDDVTLGCGSNPLDDVSVIDVIPGERLAYFIVEICNKICRKDQAKVSFTLNNQAP